MNKVILETKDEDSQEKMGLLRCMTFHWNENRGRILMSYYLPLKLKMY
jgi:hypothetical protein